MDGSPLKVTRAAREFAHPYVIHTPPYARQSAGIRVLHWLCDALNRLGAQAGVAVDPETGPVGADPAAGVAAGLQAPPLSPQVMADWRAAACTPIEVYPDAFPKVACKGVSVRYALNYLGVMASEPLDPCDLTVAYSENIRRTIPGCEEVMFIPGSDPYWWTPAGEPRHRHALLYAGKYVDYHRQTPPLHLVDAIRIYRNGEHALTTEALRTLLRTGARLYIFENTAVALEAALCGCPVVVRRNWFFPELIAEHELGLDGFTYDDTPAGWAQARATLPAFRVRYDAAMAGAPPAILHFAERTQALAESRKGVELRPAGRLIM